VAKRGWNEYLLQGLLILLSASLIFLLCTGVWQLWVKASPLRWIITLMTFIAFTAFFLSFTIKRLTAEVRIWFLAWSFLAMLLVSSAAEGTTSATGYSVFRLSVAQIFALIAGLFIIGSLVAVIISSLKSWARIALLLPGLYALAGIVQIYSGGGLELAIAGPGIFSKMPLPLRPAAFATMLYLPLLTLTAGILFAASLFGKDSRKAQSPFLFLTLILLAIIGALPLFNLLISPSAVKEGYYTSRKGMVNVLSAWYGTEVVAFSSQYDYNWSATRAIDGVTHYHNGGGWCSNDSAPFPHTLTFAIPGDRKPVLREIVLFNRNPEENKGVKEFELLGGADSASMKTLGRFKARNTFGPQRFTFPSREAGILTMVINSNWGDPRQTSFYEIEAYEASLSPLEPPGPLSRNILDESEGAQSFLFEGSGKGVQGEENLLKGDQGGNCLIDGSLLPAEICFKLKRGEGHLVNSVYLTFPGDQSLAGVKDFELYISREGLCRGYRRVGRYTRPPGTREMKCTFPPAAAQALKLRAVSSYPGKGPVMICRCSAFGPPCEAPQRVNEELSPGLLAQYFKGLSYKDLPVTRAEAPLEFAWGTGAPCEGIPAAPFFVRWKGWLQIPAHDIYEIGIRADDGFSLFIDGINVMEKWRWHNMERWCTTRLALAKGWHRIEISACNTEGPSGFALAWRAAGSGKELAVIPGNALFHRKEGEDITRSPRRAAQAGVTWLEGAAIDWQWEHRCYGCHVQTQALMGLSIAHKNSYTVSSHDIAEMASYLQSGINKDGSLSFQSSDNLSAVQHLAMALAFCHRLTGLPYDGNLVKLSLWLMSKQDSKGAFPIDRVEPPIEQGSVMTTTNSLICISRTWETTGEQRFKDALDKGTAWLRSAETQTTQDCIYQIIGLSMLDREGSKEIIRRKVEDIYKMQRADGGWSELPTLDSNAYSTGQVLYCLKTAGESVADLRFKKGVDNLLATQHVQGSWPCVNSQARRPSDFSATMWAVIGLAGSFESFIVSLESPQARARFPGRDTSREEQIKAQVYDYSGGETKEVTFHIDGVTIASVTKPPYETTWKPASYKTGLHTIKAIGKNSIGLTSSDEKEVYVTGLLSISITSPGHKEHVSGKTSFKSEVKNDTISPVKCVEYFVDGRSAGKCGSTPPFELAWQSGSVQPGEHVVKALVNNDAGESAFAERVFLVDKAFKVTITSPAANTVLDRTVSITSEVKNGTADPTKEVHYTLGSTGLGSSASPPFLVNGDIRTVPDGTYMLKARACTAGKDTAEDSIAIEVSHPFPVTMYATVKDRHGRHITTLDRSDFSLWEEGSAQADLSVKKTTEETPLSIVMLLDGSGSMAGATDLVIKAAKSFISFLSPHDRTAVITFNDRVNLLTDFTSDRKALDAAVSQCRAIGGTALYDSILRASEMLKKEKGMKALIILTDGVDENNDGTAPGSAHTFKTALEKARESECIIYSIGLGKGVDKSVLSKLSLSTGGRMYLRPRPQELQDTYREVAEELRCQYAITYYPKNRKKDGAWRNITIKTKREDCTVTTKQGYFAPRY